MNSNNDPFRDQSSRDTSWDTWDTSWDTTVPRIGIVIPILLWPNMGPLYNDHERQTRGFSRGPQEALQ